MTYHADVWEDIVSHDDGEEGVRRGGDEVRIVPALAMGSDDDRRHDYFFLSFVSFPKLTSAVPWLLWPCKAYPGLK